MSPTIPIEGKGAEKYAFRFFSSDLREPPHFHVYRGNKRAKIWIKTLELEWNRGYNLPELNEIRRLARENRALLLEVWNEHFSQE